MLLFRVDCDVIFFCRFKESLGSSVCSSSIHMLYVLVHAGYGSVSKMHLVALQKHRE